MDVEPTHAGLSRLSTPPDLSSLGDTCCPPATRFRDGSRFVAGSLEKAGEAVPAGWSSTPPTRT